jgi:gliding motility-associated-like protein
MKNNQFKNTLQFLIVTLALAFSIQSSFGQYTVNGNASKDNCNCYTLTPNLGTQSGSVWNVNKISLANPFDFNFTVYLGNSDAGADGIAFVLQPISTSVGTAGGGMGFAGVTPSIAVSIDTYQNTSASDPTYDHIAIQRNGDIDHSTSNNLAGPVQALAGNANIEDGVFHAFRVVWNPTTFTLDAYLDGSLRVSVVNDFISTTFSGDPMVFWGFTGSTGGAMNLQRFCTKNLAHFNLNNPPTAYCDSATVQFNDGALSSSNVLSWHWDFGDGTSSTDQNPVHHYGQPGTYTVKQYIVGNDGCNSDTFNLPINIYPNPVANFSVSDVCLGLSSNFLDQSSISTGNVTSWQWDFGTTPTQTSVQQSPSFTYTSDGSKNVKLIVTSDKGCKDTITKPVTVNPLPVADFTSSNPTGCSPLCVDYKSTSTVSSGNIQNWNWDFSNDISGDKDPKNCYTNSTNAPISYTTTLIVVSDKGCRDTITKSNYVTVVPMPNASFSASTQLVDLTNTNVVFTNASTNATNYSWNFGDNTPTNNTTNPSHDFPNTTFGEYTVILTASNAAGCSDTASIKITVQAPDPVYVIPNVFTPNGDNTNDVFQLANPENIKEVKTLIVNRWGNVILDQTDSTLTWNGKVNNSGQLCSGGVYFYTMKITGLNGKVIEEKGFLHLVREK